MEHRYIPILKAFAFLETYVTEPGRCMLLHFGLYCCSPCFLGDIRNDTQQMHVVAFLIVVVRHMCPSNLP